MAHASASQLPYILEDTIYFDAIDGFAGITLPIGSPGYAVNNISDLITICTARSIVKIHVKNDLTITQVMHDYVFIGDMDWNRSGVIMNNQDMDGCSFKGLAVIGSAAGYITCTDCFVSGIRQPATVHAVANLGVFLGQLNRCLVGSIQPIPSTQMLSCIDCHSVGNLDFFSLSGGGRLGWSGDGEVLVFTADNAASYFLCSGIDTSLIIAADCVAGNMIINAAMSVVDYSINNPVNVDNEVTYKDGAVNTQPITITAPANALDVTLGESWGARARCRIKVKSVVLRSNGATTIDLTNIAIYAGVAKEKTLITPAMGIRANLLTASMQVQGVGPWVLNRGETIVATLTGTGATPVNMKLYVEFESEGNSSYLYGVDLPPY